MRNRLLTAFLGTAAILFLLAPAALADDASSLHQRLDRLESQLDRLVAHLHAAHAQHDGAAPCDKGACDKARCDQGGCDKARCDKARCDKGGCDKARCDKGGCDKGGCDKARCDKGGCDKARCDKARCDKGTCDKGTCDKGTCQDGERDAVRRAIAIVSGTEPAFRVVADDGAARLLTSAPTARTDSVQEQIERYEEMVMEADTDAAVAYFLSRIEALRQQSAR